MSDLDKKLEEAVRSTVWISKIDDRVRDKVHPDWFNANGQYFTFGIDTAAVKQAFIDDGWAKQPRPLNKSDFGFSNDYAPLRTGQEWYDRFQDEYAKLRRPKDDYREIAKNVTEAAQKAAGIEE